MGSAASRVSSSGGDRSGVGAELALEVAPPAAEASGADSAAAAALAAVAPAALAPAVVAASAAAAAAKAAAKAAALGLLQPLKALSLDADTLHRAIAAAVTYCDAQGADHLADLVKHARMLITHPGPWKLTAWSESPVPCASPTLPYTPALACRGCPVQCGLL